jgi:hypothetical protein
MNWNGFALSLYFTMALGLPALMLWNSELRRQQRWRLWAISSGWLATVTVASAAGLFTTAGLGVRALGATVALPFLALFVFRRSATLKTLGATVPLGFVVLLHVGRLIGAEFLVMHAAGRLPATFARSAGWGDVITAVLAVPVAAMIYRGAPMWRTAALAWNVLGTADLLAAIALGVGSSSTFPLRFIFENPPTDAMGSLPLFLIPGFLVPFYLMTHLLMFRRLVAHREPARVTGPLAANGL